MNISIQVDTAKFDRILSDFPAAMARAQRNALMAIGAEAVSEAQRAFKYPHYRPSPWVPRKNNADPKRPLLYKSGDLRKSLDSKVISDDTVVIGSKADYAKYHQFGTKRMPARPFFPLDKHGNLTPRMERKVRQYVQDEFKKELRNLGFQ